MDFSICSRPAIGRNVPTLKKDNGLREIDRIWVERRRLSECGDPLPWGESIPFGELVDRSPQSLNPGLDLLLHCRSRKNCRGLSVSLFVYGEVALETSLYGPSTFVALCSVHPVGQVSTRLLPCCEKATLALAPIF